MRKSHGVFYMGKKHKRLIRNLRNEIFERFLTLAQFKISFHFKELAKDERRYRVSRKELLHFDIPEVRELLSMDYASNQLETDTAHLENGFQANVLPALNHVKEMLNTLRSTKSAFAIFNGKYFFDVNDLYALQAVHELKGVKNSVLEEEKWFRKLERGVKCPPNLTRGFTEALDGYKSLLFNGRDHVNVREESKKLVTGSLALLVARRWLEISVLKEFIDIRNDDVNNEPCICFKQVQDEFTAGNLEGIVEGWFNSGATTVSVVMNVGKRSGKTFISTQTNFGCHWVCFRINIKHF